MDHRLFRQLAHHCRALARSAATALEREAWEHHAARAEADARAAEAGLAYGGRAERRGDGVAA